jgi:hypothetical protein
MVTMPDLFVKSKTGKTYLNEMDQYEQQLAQIASSILSIQNNLSFQVLSRAYISSQMKSIVQSVENNSQKMKSMKSSLEEAMKKYEENELKIIAHTMGMDIGKLKELMNSGVPSAGSGDSTGNNKSWMEKLLGGDLETEVAYKSGSVSGSGSFMGAATSGTLSGGVLGANAGVSVNSEWDISKGNAGAGAKAEATGYIAKGEANGSWGYLDGSAEASFVTGGTSAEAKFTLFDDGKFDPNVSAEVAASASVLNGEAEAKFGTEDYNVHVAGEGDVLTAEAKANFELGADGVGAEAEVGAAVAKGEVSGGFTLFGIKVDLTAEGEVLGVGAGASFHVEEDSFELGGKLSFLAGLGLNLKISW